MKYKESLILIVAYLIISLLMMFIPFHTTSFFKTLYFIGIIIYIATGLLFIFCMSIGKEEAIKFGFIVGISSWILLLLSSSNSTILNINIIETWHLINTLESLNIINPVVDVDLPSYIISELLYGMNVNYVINSIGLIILTIIGCLIITYAFIKIREQMNKVLNLR